nr:magnetosome protein MamM [Desulfobacteraceae bacterium]
MQYNECEKCLSRVAPVGIWTNLVMVILKFFIGITSGSKACIADGLHSASNIITSFAITLSQRIGNQKRNDDYHYGYGKIEFLAAAFISLLIIVGALTLITLSIKHLLNEPSSPPHFSAIIIALISIGANEMMYRYMKCVGVQFKSQSVIANAWANRADCFSSIAVIIGVIGSRLGLHHLDPIAALLVVAIIIKVSFNILKESVSALLDGSVNPLYGQDIQEILLDIDWIKGVKDIKTRHIGQKIWAELSICVDQRCTMKEGQSIANRVRSLLIEKIMDLERVTIHLEPLESTL